MRRSVCVVVLGICALSSACHPKPPSGVRRLGDRLAAVGQQVAPIVMPVINNLDVKLVARVRPAPRRVDTTPPPAAEPAQQTSVPAQAAAPDPAIHVDRVNAARPTVFVLRGQTHGGQPICETHASSNECNTACTSMLRANAFSKPEPSTPKSCSCLEQDDGC